MAKKNKKSNQDDFWERQKRKILIESTGASVRLSGSKVTNEEVERIVNSKDNELYRCPECGFHYVEKEWAEKCEAWCQEHKSCNIEITAHAEENKKQ